MRRHQLNPMRTYQSNTLKSTRNIRMSEFKSQKINGGARPGAGRKKNSPNKKTAAIQKAVEESGLTPLDYMLEVMRDVAAEPRDRLSAANMAAPYVHAKLSSIELTGKDGGTIDHSLTVRFVK